VVVIHVACLETISAQSRSLRVMLDKLIPEVERSHDRLETSAGVGRAQQRTPQVGSDTYKASYFLSSTRFHDET